MIRDQIKEIIEKEDDPLIEACPTHQRATTTKIQRSDTLVYSIFISPSNVNQWVKVIDSFGSDVLID